MLIRHILTIVFIFFVTNPVFAVNIFECEDENGNITFQARCSPGSKPVNERNYSTTAPNSGGNVSLSQLTLYMVPDCDTCNQLKEFLAVRNLRYTEKDVSNDIELQNELKDIAGELQVPALVIGNNILTGYNRTALIQGLTESGHISESD